MLADKVKEFGIGYGMQIYSDVELLAILLGIDETAAMKINQRDILENENVHGVGKKSILKLAAIKEYAHRYNAHPPLSISVSNPAAVADYAMPILRNEEKEHFCVMLLDTKNHVKGFKHVSIGTATASLVHPREVFYEAVMAHATSIIAVHNHPSGDPTPSNEDIAVTKRLYDAGKIMDIPLLDHVVIGKEQFISMKEEGLFEL